MFSDVPPPTVAETRAAIITVWRPMAEMQDAALVVSRHCPRRGRRSRSCIVRIVGRDGQRYRVTVTKGAANYFLQARAVPSGGPNS